MSERMATPLGRINQENFKPKLSFVNIWRVILKEIDLSSLSRRTPQAGKRMNAQPIYS